MSILVDEDFTTDNGQWVGNGDNVEISGGALRVDRTDPGLSVGYIYYPYGTNYATPANGFDTPAGVSVAFEKTSGVPAGGSGYYHMLMLCWETETAESYMSFKHDASGLTGTIADSATTETEYFTIPYDSEDHAWLRLITEDRSTFRWESSADGITWVVLHSETDPPITLSDKTALQLYCYTATTLVVSHIVAEDFPFVDETPTTGPGALVWDEVGNRFFQTGVDRGVLYLSDNTGVAWNGITSVEETPNQEDKEFYLDGVKFLEHIVPGNYQGKLQAFTYPDEFEPMLGIGTDGSGLRLHDQPPKPFGLSYRTLIGNDISGTDYGYKLHLLYNLRAIPDASSFVSMSDAVTPTPFTWTLRGTPVVVSGFRPTAHVSIDSTRVEPAALAEIEEMLYGTPETTPTLPSLGDLLALIASESMIVITDNGDGTWSATGPDSLVELIDADTFQIEEVDATYLDEDTYQVSTTDLYD